MKTKSSILKIILITLVVIITLMVTGAIALVTLVNPNRYKPLIIKIVNASTGRKLNLNGDISWNLYPNLGLHIVNASLSNPDGFTPPNLVEVASVDIAVRLMPLFHGAVIVDSLAVDGLKLALINQGNRNNWTFNTAPTSPDTRSSSKNKPMPLELSSLSLKNSTVTYADLAKNKHNGITNFDFKVSTYDNGLIQINPDQESLILNKVNFDFANIIKGKLNFAWHNFSNPNYSGKLNLAEFSINKLLAKLNLTKPNQPSRELLDKFALQAEVAGNMDKLTLKDVNFNFTDVMQGTANINVQDLAKPQFTGDLHLPEFSLNKLLAKLNLDKPKPATKELLNRFSLQTRFAGDLDNLDLTGLNFNFTNILRGTANIKVHNLAKPQYTGNIALPTFSLNQLLEKSGLAKPDLPNKNLLNKVALQSNIRGGINNIVLDQLHLQLADSTVTGNLNIDAFTPLKLNENLTLDKAELSDFVDTYGFKLPIKLAKASGSLSTDSFEAKNFPSSLNAKQNITIENLTLLGFSVNNFINQLDNALTFTGSTINEHNNWQQVADSLLVVQSISKMKAVVDKAKAPGPKELNQQTNLGMLQANLVVQNGIVNPTSFKLAGPSIKTAGQGSINLNQKTLNYTVITQLIAPQNNPIINHIAFPYHMQGKMSNMQGALDWNSIEKQVIGYAIASSGEHIIDNEVKKAVDAVGQNINQAIKNIFGG